MGIGSGILLFVVGAILAFALNIQVTWIDLHLVGYLMMGAGVLVFIISLVLTLRKRRTLTTTRTVNPDGGDQAVQHETKGDVL
ncbi:DUF6458 family protein [Lacisediminihabitans sp.]|jgi:hypothetical protein|uniref:DUF6458 family protein n=1 Tax=Lacisediminihabitans sp. TaxID=2787631 RepID=UPI002F959883